ncbi:uncharacterized protein THITE_2113763 [Thermothielavioides terrestris NRRL 8126]|uniref:Uncharacterized protein n=1 Tax=Thermothielavioides terrestris (strain ATCC 38088 / NRRL 8126) TaxID=578455 RepID=G2R479_THETT|nr:uncharacterized protein THITE_2113763 [Thermothielavioides terrestris NRRL 8126]AEO66026.1 hypothetical protein THITE_2113763 [Thermothielavioides terrestris NRRL 8126]
MSSWRVISRQFVGYAKLSGDRTIAVSVATELEGYKRLQVAVDVIGPKFLKAVENDSSQITSTADEVCMRMPDHDFNPDEPTHFTAANFEKGVQKQPCHVKA